MMDESQAREEFCELLQVAWRAGAAAAAGTPGLIPLLLWDGQETAEPPPQEAAWARVAIKHNTERQVALSSDLGRRRFEHQGLITVQCFAPRADRGAAPAIALAKVAKDAFRGRGSPGGASFRNCRVVEVGADKGWFQANAIIEFAYDDVSSSVLG